MCRHLLLLGGLVSGLWLPAAGQAASPPVGAAALLQALDAEIGSADCQRQDQCRTVAVGHKACGGPESYRAYSTAGGREARILQLARAHADARRQEDEAAGRMSNCMALRDPGARCSSAGRCETRVDTSPRLAP